MTNTHKKQVLKFFVVAMVVFWVFGGFGFFLNSTTLQDVNLNVKHRVFNILSVLDLWEVREARATTEIFSTAGSNSWTAPANIVSVQVECWGGGGAGGGGDTNDVGGGGGGGGGAYAIVQFVTVPSTSYNYTVGAAGAGSTGNGTAGTDSTFDTTACVAEGGSGGLSAGNGRLGGAGGTTGGSTGDVTYAGGTGDTTPSGANIPGGGGGGSAGTTTPGTGNTATSQTGASAILGGGPGGNGGAAGGNGSAPASGPGGGGGGGGERSGGSEQGAAGFAGKIILTYFETVTVSGALYSDEGSTAITSGKTIKIAVGTSSPATVYSTTSAGDGTWSIVLVVGHGMGGGVVVTAWVDGDTGTRAAAVTKAKGGGPISSLDLYQNRVIVKHEALVGTSTTITDMSMYDGDNDSDIQFSANDGVLDVFDGQELHIWTGDTFAPGGTVTLHGNAAASPDGDFHLPDSATFTQGGLITLAGGWSASSTATFTTDSNGVLFNATTTGKTLSGTMTGTSNKFADVTFNGTGGGWVFSDNASTAGDFTVTAGTVSGSSDIEVAGSVTGAGIINFSGGTFELATSSNVTFGTNSGSNDWTFNNLIFSNTGVDSPTITQFASADSMDSGASFTSIAIGTDGFPVISYRNATDFDLMVTKCNDIACEGDDETTTQFLHADSVGEYSSLAISTDGFPIIAYYNATLKDLIVTKCNDAACAGDDETTTTFAGPAGDTIGIDISLVIGADDLPLIGYRNASDNEITIMKCNDIACTGGDETITQITTADVVGQDLALTLGDDGFPVMAYFNAANSGLGVMKCNDDACTGQNETITAFPSRGYSFGINNAIITGGDGNPLIAHIKGGSFDDLEIVKCNDTACTGADETITAFADDIAGFFQDTISIATSSSDGFPVIVFSRDENNCCPPGNNDDIKVLKCDDDACTGGGDVTTIISHVDGDEIGGFSDIAISDDGFPVISSINKTDDDLMVTKCYNHTCATIIASAATTTLNSGGTGKIIVNGTLTIGPASRSASTTLDANTNDRILDINDSLIVDSNGVLKASNSASFTIPSHYKNKGTFTANGGTVTVDAAGSAAAWDISTASFNHFKSVSIQETSPRAFAFKDDGTKMYVLGTIGDDVNEYSLSTPWDITTASFNQLKLIQPQESIPYGLAFSTDGTKMYVIGNNDNVYEYDLDSAWLVNSSASFLQSTTTAVEDTGPTAVVFKPDGTKMYVVGAVGREVNEYDLGIAWDVSTTLFLQRKYIGGEEDSPTGVAFKPDGTKMYVVGINGVEVNEYNLSPAWDVNSATFLQLKSVADEEVNPEDIAFKPDGTKMYIIGSDGDGVSEYDLGTTLSGNMVGSSAFYNLTITNTAATTTFGSSASTTNNFTITTDDVRVEFPAGATSTLVNLTITGSLENEIYLHSTAPGTQWNIHSTGTRAVTFVNVKDSNACSGEADISATGIDGGNNDCWTITPSSGTLSVSGTLYSDEGITQITSGKTINLAVGTSTVGVYSTTTDASAGTWTFEDINTSDFAIGTPFSVFVDADGTTRAFTITKASSTVNNITSLDLYQNRVIVRHEGTSGTSTTNTDLGTYDAEDDSDIQFSANGGVLDVFPGQELHIWRGSEFAPGGAVTLHGNAGTGIDGDLHLETANGTSSILTLGGQMKLAGSWYASSTSIYNTAGQTTVLSSTSTAQKSIIATSTPFASLNFNSSGQWSFGEYAATTTNIFTLGGSGTVVVAPSTSLTIGASFRRTNTGAIFTHNNGTVIFSSISCCQNDMTGTNAFNNVIFRDGTTNFTNSISKASTTNVTIESGATFTAPSGSLTIAGAYDNSSSGTFAHNSGTLYFDTGSSVVSGSTMTGTSAFNNVDFLTSVTLADNASTTDLTISSGTLTAPTLLSISGDYTNNSTFDDNSGTVFIDGSSLQTFSGTMIGTSAFNNLEIFNNSATTTFANSASTTATFTIGQPSSIVVFPASATSTFQNISWAGTSGNEVKLRSSTLGTSWGLEVPGLQTLLTYIDVSDSNACWGGDTLDANDGNSIDSGGTSCWCFVIGGCAVNIASDVNQVFAIGQATTIVSDITITESSLVFNITGANNIRIAIATSTHDMRWDTTVTTVTASGTAVPDKVPASATVTYEGGDSLAVIHVDANFALSEAVTLSGLKLTNFNAIASLASALDLYLGGPSDITADDSDSKGIAITGTLDLYESDAGQSGNALTGTEDAIFATPFYTFKLTASTSENVSVTAVSFPLSAVVGVVSGDITNALLYLDYGGDGAVSDEDTAVGGSGTPSITGSTGSISFSSAFTATTTRNYVLIADVNNISPVDKFTIALTSGDFTASGVTSLGSITASGTVPSVQHVRTPGGGVSSTGGGASGGAGIVGGGDSSGGDEEIGSEPGFNASTADGSPHTEWTDGSQGYSSDGNFATAATADLRQSYSTFGFTVPGGNTVNGIEVKLEASGSTAAGTIDVALSWDEGVSITSVKSTATLSNSDAVFELGGSSDLWGRVWVPDDFSNTKFRLRIIAQPSGNTVQVDAIQVKVYHSAGGGGQGGGGGETRAPQNLFFAAVYESIELMGESISRFLAGLFYVR